MFSTGVKEEDQTFKTEQPKRKFKCVHCEKDISLPFCPEFKMSVNERLEITRRKAYGLIA